MLVPSLSVWGPRPAVHHAPALSRIEGSVACSTYDSGHDGAPSKAAAWASRQTPPRQRCSFSTHEAAKRWLGQAELELLASGRSSCSCDGSYRSGRDDYFDRTHSFARPGGGVFRSFGRGAPKHRQAAGSPINLPEAAPKSKRTTATRASSLRSSGPASPHRPASSGTRMSQVKFEMHGEI